MRHIGPAKKPSRSLDARPTTVEVTQATGLQFPAVGEPHDSSWRRPEVINEGP